MLGHCDNKVARPTTFDEIINVVCPERVIRFSYRFLFNCECWKMFERPPIMTAIRTWTVSSRVCLVLFFIIPSFACSTLTGREANKDNFTSAVEAFNTALRWGDYKLAAAFVAADEQELFWRYSDLMEGRIRITNYDIRQLVWDGTDGPIPVFVKYQYFFMHDPHLQNRTIRQQWLYSEQAKGWQVTQSGLLDLVSDELPAE
jgi:hypothetical protein